MNSVESCAVCGICQNLLRCSRCKRIYYCSKSHQTKDWKRHKTSCVEFISDEKVNDKLKSISFENVELPSEGSSESEILNSQAESLSPNLHFQTEKSSTHKAIKCAKTAMPISGENIVHPRESSVRDFPEISLKQSTPPFLHRNQDDVLDEMCRNVIRDMDDYGLCVVDNFLGEERGRCVLKEVLDMYTKGVFKHGQLVSSTGREEDLKTIRGDQIAWIDGREKFCKNIGHLISQVDTLIIRANKMLDNGKLGHYNINGRTKVRFSLGLLLRIFTAGLDLWSSLSASFYMN